MKKEGCNKESCQSTSSEEGENNISYCCGDSIWEFIEFRGRHQGTSSQEGRKRTEMWTHYQNYWKQTDEDTSLPRKEESISGQCTTRKCQLPARL